jgi:hypothetical protein
VFWIDIKSYLLGVMSKCGMFCLQGGQSMTAESRRASEICQGKTLSKIDSEAKERGNRGRQGEEEKSDAGVAALH